MTGRLYTKAPDLGGPASSTLLRENNSASAVNADVSEDAAVEVDDGDLEKLNHFDDGTPLLLDATVVSLPRGGEIATSYAVFYLGDVCCGLTTITSPPPKRDTSVVPVRVGQRISLRITRLVEDAPAITAN